MKIGLVRHFKVDADYENTDMDSKTYNNWMKKYDETEVIPTEVDLRGIGWNKCYASTLPRAITTAKTIYSGEIKTSPLIEEIKMEITSEYKRKIPLFNWTNYNIIGWAKSADYVGETIEGSRRRVNEFLDNLFEEVNEDDNVLLVCHGIIMTILDEELVKRGFEGERVIAAKNGELFLFEK